jgi:type I restriction enzyme S subunit
MIQNIALSSFISYRKGKPARKTLLSEAQYLPVLTPEYLRGNDEAETTAVTNDLVVIDGGEIVLLWDGSNAGEFFKARRGILASTMVVFDFDEACFDKDYLYYALKSFEPYLKAQTSGSGIPHVDKNILLNHRIQRLQKPEQSKIAEVLATVDRAIEQTEALNSKYRRIKTGLMQDLLTRGIDENGNLRDPATHRFKPSPLGLIPQEWELSSLGQLSKRITSGSRGWAKYYAEEGAKFIRIGNLTREHVNLLLEDIQHVTPPAGSEGKRTALETGDLLVSITADLGIIGVVPEELGEAYINQHIALVRIDKEQANPWWIGNFLAGHKAQQLIAALNDAGAKAGLNLPTVASIPVPIPDMKEQDEITQILCQVDGALNTEKAYLTKLRRLKAGLMQDLLTGKVPVASLLDIAKGEST